MSKYISLPSQCTATALAGSALPSRLTQKVTMTAAPVRKSFDTVDVSKYPTISQVLKQYRNKMSITA